MMKQRQIPTKQIQILTIQKLEGGRGAVQPLAAGEWALLVLTALFLCALAFVHAHPSVIAAETEAVTAEKSLSATIPASNPASDVPADTAAVPEAVPAANIPADTTIIPVSDPAADTPADAAVMPETVPAMPAVSASALLNVNTADADALTALPGIGPVIAARIVEYRTEYGPFVTPDDLQNVKGIGPAKLAAIRDLVICG